MPLAEGCGVPGNREVFDGQLGHEGAQVQRLGVVLGQELLQCVSIHVHGQLPGVAVAPQQVGRQVHCGRTSNASGNGLTRA